MIRSRVALAAALLSGGASAAPAPDDGAFTNAVHCQFACAGESRPRTAVETESFDPNAWGLARGNNNLWGTLGLQIWNWGETVCAARAQQKCGSRARVKNFKLDRLESGTWSLSAQPSCPGKPGSAAGTVLSPYDSSQKLDRSVPSPLRLSVEKDLPASGHLLGADETCRTKIKGEFCAGDCVLFGDTQACTLCTSNPLLKRGFEVCGDAFIEKVRSARRSREGDDVLRLACETFFFDAAKRYSDKKGFNEVAGCAAFRGKPDCAESIREIRGAAPLGDESQSARPVTDEPHANESCPACSK